MTIKTEYLQNIIEQEMIFAEGKKPFIDIGLLAHVASYNSYYSGQDVLDEGEKPKRYKVSIAVYVEPI